MCCCPPDRRPCTWEKSLFKASDKWRDLNGRQLKCEKNCSKCVRDFVENGSYKLMLVKSPVDGFCKVMREIGCITMKTPFPIYLDIPNEFEKEMYKL